MTGPLGRGNGRIAESYVPLTDLEPQLADLVLDLLAQAGIAAYATPVEETAGAVRTTDPDAPDRVFVDTEERARAGQLLEENLPALRARTEQAPTSDDDVWAQLVASFNASPGPDDVAPWPDAEDLGPQTHDRRAADHDPGRGRLVRPAATDEWSDLPARETAPEASTADDDGHYVPPPPPPLPHADPVTRWAWIGLFGGPLLLVLAAVCRVAIADWMLLLGVFAFVAGFVTLVARMKDGPDAGSGPDDGAVL